MFAFAVVALTSALAASAANFTVAVGDGNQLTFSPSQVNAQIGDIINFEFRSKNHSVTQSTFVNPCTQAPNGVDSGFRLVAENPTEIPSWGITLNDTTPLWFFCAQTNPVNHCQAGMVFAINPTPDQTFDAFQANAKGSNSTSAVPSAGGASGTGAPTGGAGSSSGASGSAPVPTGSGLSLSGAATSSAAAAGASSTNNANPNGAVVVRGMSSAGAVSVVTLIAAVAGFML